MNNNPLSGLVVCGGESSRMGVDKSLIDYHGKAQRYYLYEMLESLCDQVYISCNEHQSSSIPEYYQVIQDHDNYKNTGPMAALLSAFDKYPDGSLLVVGCDYPLIKKDDLTRLIEASKSDIKALSYYNPENQIREPLLAIYKSECAPFLMSQYQSGNYSLNDFLKSVDALIIKPDSIQILKSIDTPESYLRTISELKKG